MFVSLYPLFAWLTTAELKLVPWIGPIDMCRQLIIIKGICVAQRIINIKYHALNKQRVCKKEKEKKDKSQHLAKGVGGGGGGGGEEEGKKKKGGGGETKYIYQATKQWQLII